MRISELYIHSFRGIPESLKMSFVDKQGKAVSCIIYGDNGCGKSSIVDAIEFNLQARIERSPVLKNSNRPSPISYYYKPLIGADTVITFDDGTEQKRGMKVRYVEDNVKFEMEDILVHPLFSIVPVALRRNDIISFNMVPEGKRQVLFFSFLYSSKLSVHEILDTPMLDNDPFIRQLKEDYSNLKHQRRDLVEKLAQKMNIITPESIPIGNESKFRHWFNEHALIRKISRKKKKITEARFYSTTDYLKLDRLVNKIISISLLIKECTDKIRNAISPDPDSIRDRKEVNAEFLDEASKYLLDAFTRISTLDYVKNIRLSIGNKTSASLDILVYLKNGRCVSPNKIFSEANYDLMILLLYVSLIRVGADHGQSKILIMDDVLQSVDSTIRSAFIDYILEDFPDWQLIITSHDKLWLQQLRYLFNRHGHHHKVYDIIRWSFDKGPILNEANGELYDDSLEKALGTRNRLIIAATAGVFFEKICQELSSSLHVSIHRREFDKYTIGDLWPGIKKSLKKTELSPLLDKIDSLLMIRNFFSCHYNEWAQSLSDQEIFDFGDSVQSLYLKTYCKNCASWIKEDTDSKLKTCKCQTIKY